ncbi:hypothetical protein C8D87_104414 [Lentzea atacamensis]|uniref:PII-like signaling protein n=1 Tax=Lentzea atacamensis TaxID=531938 RepID=A0ABX9E848_9PSEU|nr:DUF190 domain-containing protein [Lentzea atacamensis]RAS65863.1 hypothetical protein C8D87_104414 [Lentzea atacamensis]
MHLAGTTTRLTILIGDDDRSHHHALHHEIVLRARRAGLAGTTVLHGCEGFGTHSFVHTDRFPDTADSLPIAVIVVDTDERIQGFLPELDELVTEGTVIVDEVEVVRYTGRQPS